MEPDRVTRVVTERKNSDSFEYGRSGNRVKVYFDGDNPETLKKKLSNIKEALSDVGLINPDSSYGESKSVKVSERPKRFGKFEPEDEVVQ